MILGSAAIRQVIVTGVATQLSTMLLLQMMGLRLALLLLLQQLGARL